MFERRRAYNGKLPWSEIDEKKLVEFLREKSFNSTILSEMFPNRSLAALKSKVRKLRIKHDLFGASYRNQKKLFTEKHAKKIRPKTVYEAYCGAGHQSTIWSKHCENLFSSDKGIGKLEQFRSTIMKEGFKNANISSNWTSFKNARCNVHFFQGDVIDAAIDLKINNVQVDILDLDTCGSTLPLLPLLLNLIRPKYMLITHGEFHSMRFGRDDVLRRVLFHRDINNSTLSLTVDELSDELDKAVKIAALRSHNETKDSFWAELVDEQWLGSKFHGMLRRAYKITKAPATADCLNELLD